jgi:hypothetical protein
MDPPAKGGENAQKSEECPARADILAPESPIQHPSGNYQKEEHADSKRPIVKRDMAGVGKSPGERRNLFKLLYHEGRQRMDKDGQETCKEGDRIKKERENHTE